MKLFRLLLSGLLLLSLTPTVYAAAPDADRGPLSKVTFIHYRNPRFPTDIISFARGNKPTPGGASACYTFLASGARWKTTEPYQLNPSNIFGLSPQFVSASFDSGTSAWDNQVSFAVFGAPSLNSGADFSFDNADGQNVAKFGSYNDPDVIAVTNVWGYFGGRPSTRELVEWDMLISDSFVWGDATVDSTRMDLPNIVTHELGHSAGLGDLYNTDCQTATMYGYGTEGETSKRDLDVGDIAGITKLYR